MSSLQPGQMVGAYQILEQVGQGGMATVYRAYHAAMDRDVAIKIVPFQFAQNPDFIQRFRREVNIIAKLEHPRILPVYDSGEVSGSPYLVMRFLETGTLKERILNRPLSLDEISHILLQLTDALGYAHSRNLIHRDIKPANVLVSGRDDVFLTDFGIAKLLDATAQFTATGAITGTPAYMSPEQASGTELDARSDIYSLGIVLYEMLTRRVPYQAETPLAVILKHLQAPLPLPSTIAPDIHPAVERVLLKTLAKQREDRFPTMEAMAAAWKEAVVEAQTKPQSGVRMAPDATLLAAAQMDLTLPVEPPPPAVAPPIPQRPTARKRWPLYALAGFSGLFLLTLCLVAGVALVNWRSQLGAATINNGHEPEIVESDNNETPGLRPPILRPVPAILLDRLAPFAPPFRDGGRWDSFPAANAITRLHAHDDSLYAATYGGLVRWTPNSGDYEIMTVNDGLPGQQLRALFIEENGTIWIGSDGQGIGVYDGDRWIIYNESDGLDSGYIRDIVRYGDSIAAATYYGGAGGGVNLFDGRGWRKLPNFNSDDTGEQPHFNVNVLWADGDNLWIGGENGLSLYDGQSFQFFTDDDGLPQDNVTALYYDSANDVLLIGFDSGAVIFDGQTARPLTQLDGFAIWDIIQDTAGDYWFVGSSLLARYDEDRADWDMETVQVGDFPPYAVLSALALDNDGVLYVASFESGFMRYSQNPAAYQIPNLPRQANSWGVVSLPDGRLLFAEEYGGRVDSYDLHTAEWRPFDTPYVPLASAAEGQIWGGGYNGLWLESGMDRQNWTTADGLPSNNVFTVALRGEETWVGTDSGLVLMKDEQIETVFTAVTTGFASDLIRVVLPLDDGAVWVGGDGGLSRRDSDGAWSHYGFDAPFANEFQFVADLAVDSEGTVWAATFGDGVLRYANGEWQRFPPNLINLASPYLYGVTIGPDGGVWLTGVEGATYFNGQRGVILRAGEGLLGRIVYKAYVDETGAIWFPTDGGISRYTP